MPELQYGIKISAKDDTQGALRAGLAGFKKFSAVVTKPLVVSFKIGSFGAGALRDFQIGIKPLIVGLDRLIDRGAALEVTGKAFRSLLGPAGKNAEQLARQIVLAASGTIRLGQAMQIANRALAGGLDFKQIITAVDFISKRAITTGKDAGQALDTVVTGLSRGSTLFLDDFGILIDGIEGVKRNFDAIKGAGAFDALGPAAQKAETVRQAIAEMTQQIGRLGVTGKEAVFVFQTLKNQVGDIADKLALAVAKSKSLADFLRSARDLFQGLTEHFEAGGGFKDVLFGGGQGGGLMNILGAGAKDVGALIGRGIAAELLDAGAWLIERIPSAFDFMTAEIPKWGGLFADAAWTQIESRMPAWMRSGGGPPASQPAASQPAGPPILAARAGGSSTWGTMWNSLKAGMTPATVREMAGAGGIQAEIATLLGLMKRGPGLATRMGAEPAMRGILQGEVPNAKQLSVLLAKKGPGYTLGGYGLRGLSRAAPLASLALSAHELYKFGGAGVGLWRDSREAKRMQDFAREQEARLEAQRRAKGIGSGFGFGVGGGREAMTLAGDLRAKAAEIRAGGTGFAGLRGEAGKFGERFMRSSDADELVARGDRAFKQFGDTSFYRLKGSKRAEISRSIQRDEHELRQIKKGNLFVGQRSRKAAREEIGELERAGFEVTDADKRRIHKKHFDREVEERSKGVLERMEGKKKTLAADDVVRGGLRGKPADEFARVRGGLPGEVGGAPGSLAGLMKRMLDIKEKAKPTEERETQLIATMEKMIVAFGEMMQAFAGGEARIRRAGH